MKINMFMEGVDSYHSFQSSLIEEINKRIPINRCVITTKTHDELDDYSDSKFVCVNYDVCEHNRYEEYYNFNEMLPLSRTLLEAMKVYESTAIEMLIRNFERDVYTYDEGKRNYLRHLRFWNHLFLKEKINIVCFNNIPHHTHDYVIYCLAKVYNIPICLCADTSIQPRLSVGNDLDCLWKENYDLFLEYRKEKEITLPEDIERYYQALIYGNKGVDESAVHRGMSKKTHIQVRKKNFTQYFETKAIIKRNGSLLKQGIKKSMQTKSLEPLKKAFDKLRINRAIQKRANIKLKSMRNIAYYETLTKQPKENEKYIVFFLHLQPEATTLPQGGVFSWQELMIQILAYSAKKKGVKVYVKEHFVQPYRDKAFYDSLNQMDNVTLISSEADSKELAINCVATASCNGTILLESIFNNKPTFIFGSTGFAKAPGVYYIGNVEECDVALNEILAGSNPINQPEVRAYLKAFSVNSIRAYFNVKKYESDPTLTIEDGKNAYVDWIVSNMEKML